MSKQRPSLLVTIKERPLVFIVRGIVALVLFWTIAILWLSRASLSATVIVLAVLLAVWALAPAAWILLADHLRIRELNSTLLQRYARGLWLVAGAVVLIVTVQAIIRRQLPAWGLGPVDWKVVQEITRIVTWPIVVLLSLALFREPLGAFLRALGARASKIGVLNVSIELASLPEARKWSGPILDNLKAQYPILGADSTSGLSAALADTTPADYVIVNLEAGRAWLTSRLFILATLLPRVRPIKRIVFLSGPVEKFIGEAPPSDVTSVLALKYPWLQNHYLKAQSDAGLQPKPIDPPELTNANEVLGKYLDEVQMKPAPPAPPSKEWELEWELFPGEYAEHARWLTEGLLLEILGTKLNRYSVKRDPTVDGRASAQAVLRTEEDFVAVVDTLGSFLRLIDRHEALDQAVRSEMSAM